MINLQKFPRKLFNSLCRFIGENKLNLEIFSIIQFYFTEIARTLTSILSLKLRTVQSARNYKIALLNLRSFHMSTMHINGGHNEKWPQIYQLLYFAWVQTIMYKINSSQGTACFRSTYYTPRAVYMLSNTIKLFL